jgi:putative glutamine amidotransferase
VPVARSPDGVVEALETRAGAGWVLAVQWHPERTAAEDQQQQAIFDAFGRACAPSP